MTHTFAAPPTRREAVLRQIRGEIISGALAPGSQIKDVETASRLGISVTPVREAFTMLEAEGLIEQAHNRTRRISLVTRKSALDLIDVMAMIAGTAYRWGTRQLSAQDLAAMHDAYDEFVAAVEDGRTADAAKAGTGFSRIVITATGNEELERHAALVTSRMLRLMGHKPDLDGWQIWIDGYREVLTHLENGDHTAATARNDLTYQRYRDRLQTLTFG